MTKRKNRLDPRRCRTLLATALGTFFLVQVAAGFAIDWRYREIRFNWLEERLAKIRLEPRTPDLVLFGSSRFGTGIDVNELTQELRRATGNDDFRAFSMAMPCGDPIAMECAFFQMRKCGIRPRAVVLEMVPYSLLRVNGWYPTHVARQFELVDLPEYGLELTRSGNLGRFLLARTMPLYIHRYLTVKKLVSPAKIPEREPDGPQNPMSDDEMARLLHPIAAPSKEFRRIDGIGTKEMERAFRNYAVGGASVRAIERILDVCAKDGTRVIVVGAPLSSGYRKAITPDIDDRYRGCLDGLSERFGIPFVDCRAVLPDTLMADIHHVRGPEGAVVFSRYLGREVLGPWLEGRSPPIRLVGHEKTPSEVP